MVAGYTLTTTSTMSNDCGRRNLQLLTNQLGVKTMHIVTSNMYNHSMYVEATSNVYLFARIPHVVGLTGV